MNSARIRTYLPFTLLLAGYLLVFSTRSQTVVPLSGSLATVLPAMDGYNVTEQVVPDDERKIAGMTNYVARAYWKDSSVAFTAYVGYYDRQSQGHTMHSPRNCLPGAGWEVLLADTGIIAAGGRRYVVNKYLLKNGPGQAIVYYWYQGRGRIVANEYAVKWNLLRDAALKGHTEEALVRVVVPVRKGHQYATAGDVQAYADAEALGAEVGGRLLTDVARVVPAYASGDARAVTETAIRDRAGVVTR